MENKSADDAAAPAQTPGASDEIPAAESSVESKATIIEEAIVAAVAPTEEPETKPTGEPEVKTGEAKPEEVKVPEPIPEPVVEVKKEEPVATEPVKEPEAEVPAAVEEKVEEKPATHVEEKPATPIAEESKVVEEPAAIAESESAPAPEPEPEVVELSAPVPEQDQKDEPKEILEVGGGEKVVDISATESVQNAEPIAAPASEPVAPAGSAEVESVLLQETPTIEIPSQDTSLAVADQ